MKMSDVTALGRRVDPRYPTNLAIVALALAVTMAGIVIRLLSGAALLESVSWGFGAGFALFLAWALGRELDPDHDLSAFLGAGLVLIALLLVGTPALLAAFWLLLVVRLVNRTIGLPARPLDSLAVLGVAGWLTWQGYWMVGLVTAAAFLLDGLLMPALKYHLLVGGLALVATGALSIFHGTMVMQKGHTLPVVMSTAAMAGLFLLVIATSREVQAVGDATGKPLNPRRIQAAQVLALLSGLLFAWWAGELGVVDLLPLWAAIVGTGLYRLAILFLQRSR